MTRRLAWILLGLSGMACHAGAPAVEPRSEDPLQDLAWIAGDWTSVDADTTSEEHWTAPAGGTMLGTSRTVASGRTVFFEYLRIEADEQGIAYVASPLGRCPPTRFPMVAHDAGSVRFENPEHDDPKSIAYRRDGDTLTAEVEGPSGRRTWRYQNSIASPRK